MAYTALARRYRSRSFEEVVGQAPIARTLTNAIAADRVGHAYLFVGTRGVGKTSMARIFANALNNPEGDEQIADAIFTGQDTDAIEIDAASNRGVEQARELIASAVYRPMRGRYKVYIIDEVHMLTKDAANTLLKTLEEPPSHVKFVLCTTEPHKLLPTIRSRCQRFDFRNIPATEIAEHLRRVTEAEGIDADDELFIELARLGAGSMRDALSLLDRVIAASEAGQALTPALLSEVLGLPERELVSSLIDAIASSEPRAALEAADELLRRGADVEQALTTLTGRLRDLMIASSCGGESQLLELSGEARTAAVEQASRFDTAGLIHMIAQCESVSRLTRNSSTPRALFDACIARLAMTEHLTEAATLLASGGRGRAGKA